MTTLTTYQQRAHDTKARRQAAGKYPTAAHRAAFWKMMQGVRAGLLTKEEMFTLSTHPHLTQSQRAAWATAAARAK